jgi:hypothetical protein
MAGKDDLSSVIDVGCENARRGRTPRIAGRDEAYLAAIRANAELLRQVAREGDDRSAVWMNT